MSKKYDQMTETVDEFVLRRFGFLESDLDQHINSVAREVLAVILRAERDLSLAMRIAGAKLVADCVRRSLSLMREQTSALSHAEKFLSGQIAEKPPPYEQPAEYQGYSELRSVPAGVVQSARRAGNAADLYGHRAAIASSLTPDMIEDPEAIVDQIKECQRWIAAQSAAMTECEAILRDFAATGRCAINVDDKWPLEKLELAPEPSEQWERVTSLTEMLLHWCELLMSEAAYALKNQSAIGMPLVVDALDKCHRQLVVTAATMKRCQSQLRDRAA